MNQPISKCECKDCYQPLGTGPCIDSELSADVLSSCMTARQVVNVGCKDWFDEESTRIEFAGLDGELCYCPIQSRMWVLLTMTGLFGADQPALPQCETCDEHFNPYDMESSNGEYLEACEYRTAHGGPFPNHLPKSAKVHPYTFCSADCEHEAIEETIDGLREYSRMCQEGEIEDARDSALPEPWWAQA